MADVLCSSDGLAGRVPVERLALGAGPPGRARVPASLAGSLGPRSPQSGRGQLWCQPSASVPQRRPVLTNMAGERDGVASDLIGIDLAEPQPHQHARLAQPGEEPGLVRSVCRSVDNFVTEQATRDLARDLMLQSLFRWPGPAGAELRQREIGGELATAVPDHSPVAGSVVRQADRVPSDLTRVGRAVSLAHQDPGLVQPGENSCSVPAPAAAVDTSRRSVARGASAHPRRIASSVSARVARRAAVRSAGAVLRSPNRRSASQHASRAR